MPGTMNDFFMFLTGLMTEHADFFEAIGLAMFRGFAVILISWFGVKSALASASGGVNVFQFDRFADLLITIAFGFGMITYYSRPIPGFGVSFYHLVIDQGLVLANALNHGVMQTLWDRLDAVYLGTEQPALALAFNVVEFARYWTTVLLVVLAKGAVFAVISFGYIAASIAVLLGPLFIPFFIVPHMEWMFWGWVKSLIQYAFYPVVANAYVYVFGQLVVRFIDQHPPPYQGGTLVVLFVPLLFLLTSFTVGVLKVPSLVNSLFAGRSGESALPHF
jgi:type IV secretory pathway VirB6-like protein